MQDVLNRGISLGLGDHRVESWVQVAEDAFGNALGNAAIGAINEANAHSEAQQQAQLEATTQQMQSSFSNELQGDIDAQTGQAIQAQFASGPAQGNVVAIGYQAAQTQDPYPAAPAAGASIPPLPNGDTVEANGDVYKDGARVGHPKPIPGKDFQHGAFQYGDRDVPPVLSSTAVWSPIPQPKEIGREEALFRRTDHRLPA